MRASHVAAVAALAVASPLAAQPAAIADLSTAAPLSGRWTLSATADGSEATFLDSGGRPQLWLHCARVSRTMTIARPASAAAPTMSVWTSLATRTLLASFNPAAGRSVARLSAYDSLLDALAFSRGRIGIAVGNLAPLVAPAWPEIARVVEDCRS